MTIGLITKTPEGFGRRGWFSIIRVDSYHTNYLVYLHKEWTRKFAREWERYTLELGELLWRVMHGSWEVDGKHVRVEGIRVYADEEQFWKFEVDLSDGQARWMQTGSAHNIDVWKDIATAQDEVSMSAAVLAGAIAGGIQVQLGLNRTNNCETCQGLWYTRSA